MWRRGLITAAARRVRSLLRCRCSHGSSVGGGCATVTGRRMFSSGEQVGDKMAEWSLLMEEKYGTGVYKLFRPLYKDLSDEMRREINVKPPPPIEGGRWSVHYDEAVNSAVFMRPADENTGMGRVVAYSPVVVGNPPKLNDVLYFIDWFPVEVLVVRNGVIVHFSMAANEGGMHMRNVRAYKEEERLMSTTDDAAWVRRTFYYDGPCLWHLELDLQNELYDVMQDHGITLDWMRWAAEWVFYFEHVAYIRWCVGMLEELIPSAHRGPEEDFLTAEEKEELGKPVENCLDRGYA